jgi:hypothetical protein
VRHVSLGGGRADEQVTGDLVVGQARSRVRRARP